MLNPAVQIDLKELSLYLMNLVSTSCELLHHFSMDSELSWKGKNKNNPVTEADYLIQHFIVSRLKDRYGEHCLSIIAEEDLTYKTCPQFKERVVKKVQEIKVSETVAAFPKVVEFEGLYEAKELCIWIDPLDCTQGFINQRKHEVTILIGVSYKGAPICGMIGHPYKLGETGLLKKPAAYQPSVYFGSSELRLNHAFEYMIEEQAWRVKAGTGSDEQQQLFAISKTTALGYRKMSARQEKVVQELGLKVVRAGGAGYKCLKVINKEVGSLMFIDAKTSKWDTCAGEAIIRGMGGFTATQHLEQIEYCPQKSSENSSGFVFSLFKELPAAVSALVS